MTTITNLIKPLQIMKNKANVSRYGEWLDMLANTGGVLLAIIITQALLWLAPKQLR